MSGFGSAENITATMVENSAEYDATNEEEESLNPADVEGGANDDKEVDPDATSSMVPRDDSKVPNNEFCFTEDDFLQSVIGMNDTTRHQCVWHDLWHCKVGLNDNDL